ncbi:hypothetical protein VNO78_34665 [Psophocarpus tetragonolobus]|uniref:Uncharacterized protein n=1 Tax=Psophocarpus tetragonolobus TaxID=3891 RepID=A0AAN9NNS0_PSOTE
MWLNLLLVKGDGSLEVMKKQHSRRFSWSWLEKRRVQCYQLAHDQERQSLGVAVDEGWTCKRTLKTGKSPGRSNCVLKDAKNRPHQSPINQLLQLLELEHVPCSTDDRASTINEMKQNGENGRCNYCKSTQAIIATSSISAQAIIANSSKLEHVPSSIEDDASSINERMQIHHVLLQNEQYRETLISSLKINAFIALNCLDRHSSDHRKQAFLPPR